VQKNHRQTVAVGGNLIECVGVVNVRSCSFARHIEPILSRVVLAFNGVGNTSARLEKALFFDYDAILRACALLRIVAARRQHHSGGKDWN
jgi:hypothetical protein